MVDNASEDGSGDLAAAHPSHPEVLRLPVNTGYAGGIQAVYNVCTTPFLAWLNDDARPEPGWLAAMEDALDDPTVGAASAKLMTPGGAVQSIGVGLSPDGYGYDVTEIPAGLSGSSATGGQGSGQANGIFGFCGGAALVRTEALREVGGVPAEFFCYYEDTDTSWRLRNAGWRIVSVPEARVVHDHGATSKPGSVQFHRWNERNRLLMLLRCAPLHLAAREFVRFALITALLPFRRNVPDAANFKFGLRVKVLGEVLTRLPWCLRSRAARRSGRRSPISPSSRSSRRRT